MKRKRLRFSTMLLFGLGVFGLQAQTMYVKENTGTQTAYTLSSLRTITFLGGNVTVQKTDNSTGIYAISGLRYLNFKDLTTGIKEQNIPLSNTKLSTYPNPVTDLLNIDLADSQNNNGVISILSFDGKVLLEQKVTGAGIVKLDVSQLPRGIYLCRYSNATEVSTVKIAKK